MFINFLLRGSLRGHLFPEGCLLRYFVVCSFPQSAKHDSPRLLVNDHIGGARNFFRDAAGRAAIVVAA